MSSNLQATRWTDDPVQQEQFFKAVAPKIHVESKYVAGKYHVGMYLEDIESDVKAKLWRQMLEIDTGGPFAKDSPEEAAGFFLEKENYRIRELARPSARKVADEHKKRSGQAKKANKRKKRSELAKKADEHEKQSGQADDLAEICWPKKRSRQADDLANVRQPDLPPDVETQLFAIAKGLPRITSGIPKFTPRDNDITCKEVLRQVGIDDLPAPIFDQVAQAAGVSSSEQRAYNKYHDEHGHLSPSDRKAWSRARAKVAKALTRAALTSLLAIIFALSVALLNTTHQGRSSHQNDFVNQGSFTHQDALAHQGNLIDQNAFGHQGNLIHQNALAHQGNLIHQNPLAHQGNLIHQNPLAHQGNLVNEITLAHQGNLI